MMMCAVCECTNVPAPGFYGVLMCFYVEISCNIVHAERVVPASGLHRGV
jgi:hypothetical protein